MRVGDETQAREAAVRHVADAILEERTQREEASVRERHAAEEDLQRAVQLIRRQAEDDERRMQERLMELSGALASERDTRTEAIKSARQHVLDVKEDLNREQKSLDRDVQKMSQSLVVVVDESARCHQEYEGTLKQLMERFDSANADLVAESTRREAEVKRLDHRTSEIQSLLVTEAKERREMDVHLRRTIEEEAHLREAALAADRRARIEKPLAIAGSPSLPSLRSTSLSMDLADRLQVETQGLREAFERLQDRLSQAELRQKGAEERTVSMLDAIMSGLTTSGE